MRIFICLGCYLFFSFSVLAKENNLINRGSISLLDGFAQEKAEFQGDIVSANNYGVAFDIGIIKVHPNLKIAITFIKTEAKIKDGNEISGTQIFSRKTEENQIQEIDLGVLYILNKNSKIKFRFYVGGGIANISSKQNADGKANNPPNVPVPVIPVQLSGSGSGNGYFLNTGIKYVLKKSFNIGLDLRDSSSNFKITGKSTATTSQGVSVTDYESPEKNFGFNRLMLTLGYNF